MTTATTAIADGLAVTRRNLIGYVRIPQAAFFSTVQPIMFVLMFRYVFGGAVNVPGKIPYVDFLMPGIFVQTVMFGGVQTAIGLADDLGSGLLERFRSLPMARSAVLSGRTAADLVRNVFVVFLMVVIGFLVGFRVHTNVVAFLGAIVIVLLFSYVVSWGFAFVGLGAPNGETAQLMSFPIIFPFVFASSALVPVQTMPGWLQVFARNQPMTQVVNAVRALLLGGPTAGWVVRAVLWSVGLILVFVPLAVRKYRRAL